MSKVLAQEIKSLDEIQSRPDFKEKFLAEDPSLLWEILQATSPMIESFAKEIWDDPVEVEELRAELFNQLYTHLPKYKPEPDFPLKAWIYGFMKHKKIEYTKALKEKRQFEVAIEDIVPEGEIEIPEFQVAEREQMLNKIFSKEMKKYYKEIKELIRSKFGEEGLAIFNSIIEEGMEFNKAWKHFSKTVRDIPRSTFWAQWQEIVKYIQSFAKEMQLT
jgi:DNA-directed RNA polymerase specialized sigma24 family protein